MDLRRLQLFLAVSEHGGFTKAAKALYLSQPALSQGIRELENELGVDLFHRLGRRVTLTPAGEALVGPARRALRDVEAGRAAVESVSGLNSGRLDLASLPSLAADPLAPLIGTFRRLFPGVSVMVSSPRDPTDLVRLLQDGICEVGVTDAQEVPPSLASQPLLEQELIAALPADSSAQGSEIEIEELAGMPMVSTPAGTSTRHALDKAFSDAGLAPRIEVVTAQRDAILPLVGFGAGAAILPRPLANASAAHGVKVLSLKPRLSRSLVLTHRRGSLSPAAIAFVESVPQYNLRD